MIVRAMLRDAFRCRKASLEETPDRLQRACLTWVDESPPLETCSFGETDHERGYQPTPDRRDWGAAVRPDGRGGEPGGRAGSRQPQRGGRRSSAGARRGPGLGRD